MVVVDPFVAARQVTQGSTGTGGFQAAPVAGTSSFNPLENLDRARRQANVFFKRTAPNAINKAAPGFTGNQAFTGGKGVAALAGVGTLLSGGSLGEGLGSAGGVLAGSAFLNPLLDKAIMAPGLHPALKGAAIAGKYIGTGLLAPMLGSKIGGGIQNAITGSSYGKAAAEGANANAQSLLNPNSLGNLVDSNMAKILKEGYANSELVKKYGLDNVMIQEAGMNRVAIPLMREQAAIGARMMPLNVAARNSVNTVAGMNQGMNTSIAGINALAQQVAANNPYNFQV